MQQRRINIKVKWFSAPNGVEGPVWTISKNFKQTGYAWLTKPDALVDPNNPNSGWASGEPYNNLDTRWVAIVTKA